MTSRPRRSRGRPRSEDRAAAAPVAWASATERYAPWIVFSAGAVIRLAVAASLADLPLVRSPRLDSAEYLSWARRMAAGNLAWPSPSAHGPGYPLFLATVFALGGSPWSAIVVQCAIGALTASCIATIAARWFGWRAGLAAGLLYAAFGPAVFVETSLLAEGLLLGLLVVALALISVLPDSTAGAAAAGLLLGAAVLVRPTALLILAALAIAMLWTGANRRRRAGGLVMLAGAVIVVGPALVKNWHDTRTLGIQGFGGLNAYIGNSPLHTGTPVFRLGAGWDALNAEARLAGSADPASQDRYYLRKTAAEIRSHPLGFLRLLTAKTLWLVQADEVRDSHSFYFFAGESWLLGVLLRMAILVPLACVGAVAATRTRNWPAPLVAYAVGAAISVVVFVVGTRYRLPIVPVYAVLGGLGVATTVDAWRRRDRRALTIAAIAALAGIGASHMLRDPSSHNLSEEWAMTGSALVTEHDLAGAESAYRRALAIDPESGIAWDGLGLTLYDAQRWREARVALDRAAALDPVNARTAYYLGLVDDADARPDAAVVHLRQAIAIDPTNLDASRHLASDLIALHRDSEAVPILEFVVAHASNDATSRRALAGALGATGRLADARRELETTVRLDGSNAEAWLDLCLIALDQNQPSDARADCARARQLGASGARLGMAERALEARGLPHGK